MDSLRTQALQKDRSSDPPEAIEGLLDINVLPARYQPQRPSISTILAWLLFIVLVGMLYLSFLRFQEGTGTLAAQQLRFQSAQEALQEAEVQPAAIEQLQAEVEALRTNAAELEQALAEVNIQLVQWGPRLRQITRMAPADVRIIDLTESQAQVNLTGLADTYQAALDYRDDLATDDELSEVQLLSIRRVTREVLEEETAATAEPQQEEAPPTEAPPEFLYEFNIRLLVPAAVRPTPSQEVSE